MDDLRSWNDTPTTASIVSFAEGAAQTVPPEERVAVFDNDGTLWCEKPMPVELVFILQRLAAMAEAGPARVLRCHVGRRPWRDPVVWIGHTDVDRRTLRRPPTRTGRRPATSL